MKKSTIKKGGFMKKGLLNIALAIICSAAFAQVDIDKNINLTGSGNDARVMGIKQVNALQDAINVNVTQQGNLTYANASGTGTAYTVTINPYGTSYTEGTVINFKANVTNTGPVTLQVNALAAVSIKKDVSVDLAAGDIQAGQIVTVAYDGTNFQIKSRTQVNNTGGTVTQVNSGAGLTGGPVTTTGTLSVANGGVTNSMLQNSSVNVTAGTGLSGGGSLSLGSAVSVALATPVIVSSGGTGASGLTGAVIGNGTSPLSSAAAAGALQYLRRNSANTAYEFGQIDYSHITGTPSGLPPSGAASGDLTGTYPSPSLANAGTAGTYNYVTTDAKGRVTSGALRSLTGTASQLDVINGNFSANPTVGINPTYTANLKATTNMTGGGNITYSGGVLSWSNRFIIINNGNGSHFTTNGYFDIYQPPNGTVITGVGGAGDQTASGGVPVPCWQALYYILPIGSNSPTVNSNFRLVNYHPTNFVVPENWVLLAANNCDNTTLRLGNGLTLSNGQTWPSGSGMTQSSGSGNYIQNQSGSAQSANFNISSLGDAQTLHSKTNDSWLGHTNGNNYLRGQAYSFNSTWYDESNTGYYVDPNNTTTNNYMLRNYGYNGVEYDANDGNFYVDPNGNSVVANLYQNCPGPAAHNVMGDLGQWLGYGGQKGLAQYQYNYLWPGRVDGGGWQSSWYLASHGSYGLYSSTGLAINGNLWSDGTTVIDYGSTWHRSTWDRGWYNGSYGGGWYMGDGTWIRTYNGRSALAQVYSGSPAVRGDNAYSGGYGGEFYSYDYGYGAGIYTGGYVYCYTYYLYSTREKKKDIEKFGRSDYASALSFMDKLNLSYYKFKEEDKYPKIHVGLIAEETPTVLTAPGKAGVSYDELAIFNTGAVKELKSKIERIESSNSTLRDFGEVDVSSLQQQVRFTDEFKQSLNGQTPVVSITGNKLGVKMYVSSVNAEGFTVESNTTMPNLAFNWIAQAKGTVATTPAQDGRRPVVSKFDRMLLSAENDTRPVPKLSDMPKPAVEDPTAPSKVNTRK